MHELGQSRRAAVSAIPSNQRRVPLSQRSQAEIPRLHDIDVTVTVASITDSQGQPVSLEETSPWRHDAGLQVFQLQCRPRADVLRTNLIALFGPSDPQSLGADQEAYAFAINGGQGAPFKVTYTYGPVGTTSYAAPLTFEGEGVVVTVTTYAAVVDGVPVTLQTTPYPAVGPEAPVLENRVIHYHRQRLGRGARQMALRSLNLKQADNPARRLERHRPVGQLESYR